MENETSDGIVYKSTVIPLQDQLAINGETISLKEEKFSRKVKNRLQKWFSRKTIEKRVPILVWGKKYNLGCLFGDFVAGFTIGLMIIPQALAYGIVAGLPPNYGLYSAFMPCFVYAFLGSTVELNIGITAIMALMTLQYSNQGGPDYAVLLCLTSGILEIFAAVVNLGFLINFISQPVISGFCSAAAITIASSQLKGLFGLNIKTKGLLDTWIKVVQNIGDFRWQDLTLGIICIVVITFTKEMRTIKWKCLEGPETPLKKQVKKTLFFMSVGRNALIVIIASLIAFFLREDQPFTLTGFVEPGVPSMQLPPFETEVNNVTMSFTDIMSDVGVGVVVIPFIAILDNIAILSAFAKGKTFDATQEIFTLGISIPVTGSLSRTAVNIASGVRSPAGGIVTGSMVLLALAFLTPYFEYIPKATLAAVIICAVLHMVDYEIVMPIWRSKRIDMIPLLVTFIACMFWGLEWGILLGIGINMSMLLFLVAVPTVKVSLVDKQKFGGISYILITPSHGLPYPSISYVRSTIRKAGIKQGRGAVPVVVDASFFADADYTSAKGIKGMVEDFDRRNQTLIFVGLKPKVMKIICALHESIQIIPDLSKVDEKLEELLLNKDKDGLQESQFIEGQRLLFSPNTNEDDEEESPTASLLVSTLDLREEQYS